MTRPSTIRTRRLVLRPLSAADAQTIADLASDWDVARMTARVPFPYSRALVNHWIDDLSDGEVVMGIEHDGHLIGVCGYTPDGASADLGYWIGRPWWGQGFATEAAAALLRHCFRQRRIRRITAGHFVDNPASKRVIAKLGFKPVGQELIWCEARGKHVAAVRYERRTSIADRLGLRAA